MSVNQPLSSLPGTSPADLWKKICSLLSRELSERSFKTWFEPISLLDVSAEALTLSVPDQYYGKWTTIRTLFLLLLKKFSGAP